MGLEIVFKSEYIIITKENNEYFIQSLKPGMSINNFNDILQKFPEIKITNFMAIKTNLISNNSNPEKFGESKPRICVDFSVDLMKGYVTLCVDEREFEEVNKAKLVAEIVKTAEDSGIKEGINIKGISDNGVLCNGKQILVAEGIRPINGKDSVVTRYIFHDAKPKVSEDKHVNFYEIDLINRVAEKDIIGQWTEPTLGTAGKNIKGQIVEALAGRSSTITYDPTTIYEENKDGKIILYSMKNGAVELKDNIMTVMDHMEVPENVNFKTGNINFDGSVTIKGIVEDTFSVSATKDIEIQSSQGLGSVKEIVSLEGSVYIKGGVNGKERSLIKAKKNVFLKYAKDVKIVCEGTVNIGAYAFNCCIKANQVIVESSNGQIVGGSVEVVSKISCAIIGSSSEILTKIQLSGVERDALNEEVAALIKEADNTKILISKTEMELVSFKGKKADPSQVRDLKIKMNTLISQKNQLKELEKDRKERQDILKIRGECEVITSKNIYPNSLIMMKHELMKVDELMGNTHLTLEDNQIKQL